MQYRINYNGQQILGTYDSYAEAREAIIAASDHLRSIGQGGYDSAMWLQRYEGDGEWSGAALTPEQRKPHMYRDRRGIPL